MEAANRIQKKDMDANISSSNNKMAHYMQRGAAVQGKQLWLSSVTARKDKKNFCLVAILRGSFRNLLRQQTGAETTGHIPKTESQTGNPARGK